MLSLICNKKGVGMIEVLIAIFLTTTGILALLALQDPGWKNMAKADYYGRAAGILYKTLEDNENKMLNPCNYIAQGTNTVWVTPSGQTAANAAGLEPLMQGDVKYMVTTTIARTDSTLPKQYLITVTVTWPPINTIGISESMVVTWQDAYRYSASSNPPKSCAPSIL